jgi:hypothetical protein
MIKIERNEKMEKAIARCKTNHPKVRRVDASTVKVYGHGGSYTVKFAEPRKGLRLASCTCQATGLCYHIPGAMAAPTVIAVAPALPVSTANERENACLLKPQPKGFIIDGWSL